MSREPVFEHLLLEAEDWFHRHHDHQEPPHYHQQQDSASTEPAHFPPSPTSTVIPLNITLTTTPAATETSMAIADIENEIRTLAEHAKRIEAEVLPAALDGLKKLEGLVGNPAVDAVLAATHVPVEALAKVVAVAINGLEDIYTPETAVAAPAAPAVPEVPGAPAEPAPAA